MENEITQDAETNDEFLERITCAQTAAHNEDTFERIACDIYGSLLERCDLAQYEANGAFDELPPFCTCLYCAMPAFRLKHPSRFSGYIKLGFTITSTAFKHGRVFVGLDEEEDPDAAFKSAMEALPHKTLKLLEADGTMEMISNEDGKVYKYSIAVGLAISGGAGRTKYVTDDEGELF